MRNHQAFKALGSLERYGVVVNGKSFFDVFVRDKFLYATKSFACLAFGLTYNCLLAATYARVGAGAQLRARNPEETLDEGFILGLMGWIDTPQQIGFMMECLSISKTGSLLSRRSCIIYFRYIYKFSFVEFAIYIYIYICV